MYSAKLSCRLYIDSGYLYIATVVCLAIIYSFVLSYISASIF